jgi:CubicO group peptidase (beta-lactamase class C family)
MRPMAVKHAAWALWAAAVVGSLAAARSADSVAPVRDVVSGVSRTEQLTAAAAPVAAWNPVALDEGARSLARLHSLLVSHNGGLVFERYYNAARRERPANIKSASKSVISALVGIAIDRKLIPDVETPIVTYFPELAQDPDRRKREITIEHLLTMRPGLEGTSNRNYGAWVTSRNWVRHALARPMFAAPGEEMEYSTGNTHLLSAILTKATGRSTWQFANDVLAKPLGFTLPQWPRDPQGTYFGGNDMLMTPRQMIAFGEMYLNEGRAARGGPTESPQVVSASWVEKSCEGRTRNRRPGGPGFNAQGVDPLRDRQYGYGWWVYEIRGYDTCFAWGYGGQYIFVVPELDLVMVTTSSPDVSEERRGHRRLLFDLIDAQVVAPAAARAITTAPSRTTD